MKKEFLVSGKQFFVNETAPLVAGDSNCYELVFYAPCDLSDYVFTVTATRSDGEVFTGLGTVFGKTARYVLENDMYAVTGPLKIRTTITGGCEREITANEITFDVIEGTNSDEAVKADTNYPVLTQLVLKVQDIVNSVPDVKEVIEKAENAAEIAETKAMFANAEGENAKISAEQAQKAADRVKKLTDKIESVENALPPGFSETDKGKILYLSKNSYVSELVSASRSYSFEDAVVLDAGLLDEERAFIDISYAELLDIGIQDPMDERCAFGFQLIPDSLDYTTDYDIMVDGVEETDEGIRMIFPAEHCEPFAENNIQSASDLFSIFEKLQFNSDFPKNCVAPVWGAPEEVLPASFLDENIISPSVRLANEYTDSACENIKNEIKFSEEKNSVYSYSFAKDIVEIGQNTITGVWVVYYDEQLDDTTIGLTVADDMWEDMVTFNRPLAVFYNPKTGDKLIITGGGVGAPPAEEGGDWELSYHVNGRIEPFTKEEFVKKYTHFGTYVGKYEWKSEEEVIKPAKNYTDSVASRAEENAKAYADEKIAEFNKGYSETFVGYGPYYEAERKSKHNISHKLKKITLVEMVKGDENDPHISARFFDEDDVEIAYVEGEGCHEVNIDGASYFLYDDWGTSCLGTVTLCTDVMSCAIIEANVYTDDAVNKLSDEINADIKSAGVADSVYSYSFAKDIVEIGQNTITGIWAVSYDEQLAGTTIGLTVADDMWEDMVTFNRPLAVFYNPKTGDKLIIAGGGVGAPPAEEGGDWELSYFVNGRIEPFTKEEFVKKYTHFGTYVGKYEWKSEEDVINPAKNYTDSKIKEAIIESWEVAV